MIYLLLSILASSLIYLCFKNIKKQGAHNFSVILTNYWIAGLTGVIVAWNMAPNTNITLPLLMFAAILGFTFITIFIVMSNTTQVHGVGTASVASKMSVVIPVCIGLIAYQESLSPGKLIGLVLALISVYLVSYSKNKSKSAQWWLPVLLFIGSGIVDTLLKKGQLLFHGNGLSYWLIPLIFMFAAIYGTAYGLFTKKLQLQKKEIKLGITLGAINYASILFLILTLAQPTFESSAIFPINNVGVVTLSAIFGFTIYKEQITKSKVIGIALAIIATLLIGFN